MTSPETNSPEQVKLALAIAACCDAGTNFSNAVVEYLVLLNAGEAHTNKGSRALGKVEHYRQSSAISRRWLTDAWEAFRQAGAAAAGDADGH